ETPREPEGTTEGTIAEDTLGKILNKLSEVDNRVSKVESLVSEVRVGGLSDVKELKQRVEAGLSDVLNKLSEVDNRVSKVESLVSEVRVGGLSDVKELKQRVEAGLSDVLNKLSEVDNRVSKVESLVSEVVGLSERVMEKFRDIVDEYREVLEKFERESQEGIREFCAKFCSEQGIGYASGGKTLLLLERIAKTSFCSETLRSIDVEKAENCGKLSDELWNTLEKSLLGSSLLKKKMGAHDL
ncbi:MAG: hypothetical protein QW503_02820, partial [Sulfolobales archaeon]